MFTNYNITKQEKTSTDNRNYSTHLYSPYNFCRNIVSGTESAMCFNHIDELVEAMTRSLECMPIHSTINGVDDPMIPKQKLNTFYYLNVPTVTTFREAKNLSHEEPLADISGTRFTKQFGLNTPSFLLDSNANVLHSLCGKGHITIKSGIFDFLDIISKSTGANWSCKNENNYAKTASAKEKTRVDRLWKFTELCAAEGYFGKAVFLDDKKMLEKNGSTGKNLGLFNFNDNGDLSKGKGNYDDNNSSSYDSSDISNSDDDDSRQKDDDEEESFEEFLKEQVSYNIGSKQKIARRKMFYSETDKNSNFRTYNSIRCRISVMHASYIGGDMLMDRITEENLCKIVNYGNEEKKIITLSEIFQYATQRVREHDFIAPDSNVFVTIKIFDEDSVEDSGKIADIIADSFVNYPDLQNFSRNLLKIGLQRINSDDLCEHAEIGKCAVLPIQAPFLKQHGIKKKEFIAKGITYEEDSDTESTDSDEERSEESNEGKEEDDNENGDDEADLITKERELQQKNMVQFYPKLLKKDVRQELADLGQGALLSSTCSPYIRLRNTSVKFIPHKQTVLYKDNESTAITNNNSKKTISNPFEGSTITVHNRLKILSVQTNTKDIYDVPLFTTPQMWTLETQDVKTIDNTQRIPGMIGIRTDKSIPSRLCADIMMLLETQFSREKRVVN